MLHHVGDSQHSQHIQINKVVAESGKCAFSFMEKTKGAFGPTQLSPCFRSGAVNGDHVATCSSRGGKQGSERWALET